MNNFVNHRNVVLKVLDKYSNDISHALFVEKTALFLFDKFKIIHKLNNETKYYLSHASLLHDIGYYINKKKHHKHSKYLIENDSMLSFYNIKERNIVSHIARNHCKKISEKTYFLSPEQQLIVLKLSSILRISDGFAYLGVIKIKNIEILNHKILLTISGINNFQYAIKRLEKKKDLFIKLFSKEIFIKES